mmetsp:Transcript_11448/g.17116  ORF Transcript_11448/g.17116 Transcript_11448/m.17116 type:complete len:250 (+) Transcript_11448:1030-1779(+)
MLMFFFKGALFVCGGFKLSCKFFSYLSIPHYVSIKENFCPPSSLQEKTISMLLDIVKKSSTKANISVEYSPKENKVPLEESFKNKTLLRVALGKEEKFSHWTQYKLAFLGDTILRLFIVSNLYMTSTSHTKVKELTEKYEVITSPPLLALQLRYSSVWEQFRKSNLELAESFEAYWLHWMTRGNLDKPALDLKAIDYTQIAENIKLVYKAIIASIFLDRNYSFDAVSRTLQQFYDDSLSVLHTEKISSK